MGAGLLAVPVAVAAAIGFGNGFSAISSGLSAIANGPASTTTTTTTSSSPRTLDAALAAIADPAPGDGADGGGSGGGGGSDGGGFGGTNTGGGSGGSGDGGSANLPVGGGVPDVTLPPGGGGGDGSTDVVGDTVNELGNTVDGLLGAGNSTP